MDLNSPTYAIIKQELTMELYNKVKDDRPKYKIKYDNWARFLEIVYGDKPDELNLFITHTYLSTFAKLLVYLKINVSKKVNLKNYEYSTHILWVMFSQQLRNSTNFVEDDFFTWT